MITYQLDQCVDSRRLVETCTHEGNVDVRRFPWHLKDQPDDRVLAELLPCGCPILTTDREIHFNWSASIPDEHPGILIVANSSPAKTMTRRGVMAILERFKMALPTWQSMAPRNLVVELTDKSVEVWRVRQGQVGRVGFVQLEAADWIGQLSKWLAGT